MNINFGGLKQDYSYLFSGLNNTTNSNDLFSSINLSDYNSIKSGTYGKLLKEYYKTESTDTTDSKNTSSKNKSSKTDSDFEKALKEVQTEAEALRESVGKLMQRGSKSVFKDEDMEKVYTAVSDFVNDYNSVMDKGEKSGSKNVARVATGLVSLAGDYEKELSAIGITMGKDNRLVIDKDTFLKADVDKVKELFNGQNSFAYLTSVRALSVSSAANNEANKSGLYTADGSYTSLTSGDLFNGII